jgi:hypothetical protein
MITGWNDEGSFNYQHNVYISIAGICETGASGKMVSGAVVPGAGWADRGGLARRYPLLKICPYFYFFK